MRRSRCRCQSSRHEQPECSIALRAAMYAGLYDDGTGHGNPPPRRVRLLNPAYAGSDPTALRFALLEID
jgi:hypothetical protein